MWQGFRPLRRSHGIRDHTFAISLWTIVTQSSFAIDGANRIHAADDRAHAAPTSRGRDAIGAQLKMILFANFSVAASNC